MGLVLGSELGILHMRVTERVRALILWRIEYLSIILMMMSRLGMALVEIPRGRRNLMLHRVLHRRVVIFALHPFRWWRHHLTASIVVSQVEMRAVVLFIL